MGSRLFIYKCDIHGNVKHRRRLDGGIRCTRCEIAYLDNYRTKRKEKLVILKGGKCSKCKYDKFPKLLEFHHLEPSKKSFELSLVGMTKKWKTILKEADKCILICRNCHAEVHYIN